MAALGKTISQIGSSAVRGALAGAVATVPMTLAMNAMRDQLPNEQRQLPLPPDQLTRDLESTAGVSPDPKTHDAAANFSHYAFGAFCGLVYGVSLDRTRANAWLKAPAFALGVWGTSYLGWVPALRLTPAATRESKERNLMMIAAHVVWGLAFSRLIQQSPSALAGQISSGVKGRDRGAKLVQRAFA